MDKEIYEQLKKIGEQLGDSAKSKVEAAKKMYDKYSNLSDEKKCECREEILNSGKNFVKETLELFKDSEDEKKNNEINDIKGIFSLLFSNINKELKEKYTLEIIEILKQVGLKYGKKVKDDIDEKLSKFVYDNKNEIKFCDDILKERINSYSNKINECQRLVISYNNLSLSDKEKLYKSLCSLYEESKTFIKIYDELIDSEKENYYSILKFSTLNLYSMLRIYNNSYNHDKYNDYIKVYGLYDNVIDNVEDKVVGVISNSACLFDKHLYNSDGYMRRYDGIIDKTNRVCIYDNDDYTAIYMDNCDYNYKAMPDGYNYKEFKKDGKLYTANCSLDYIVDYTKARYDMYNEYLVIPPYYEEDKTTLEEINKVLNYIESKHQLSNGKKKIK